MNGQPWTKEEINLVIKLYNDGLPVKDIAKNLSRTETSVIKKLWKLGHKGRPRTKEHCRNLSMALMGNTPWNKGAIGLQMAWNKGKKCPHVAGNKNPNWHGGRKERVDGYVYIFNPDHPHATKDGYVMEHVLVMEKAIGKFLNKGEVVHHINRKRNDNRPENLEVFASVGAHTAYHAKLRRDKLA